MQTLRLLQATSSALPETAVNGRQLLGTTISANVLSASGIEQNRLSETKRQATTQKADVCCCKTLKLCLQVSFHCVGRQRMTLKQPKGYIAELAATIDAGNAANVW